MPPGPYARYREQANRTAAQAAWHEQKKLFPYYCLHCDQPVIRVSNSNNLAQEKCNDCGTVGMIRKRVS